MHALAHDDHWHPANDHWHPANDHWHPANDYECEHGYGIEVTLCNDLLRISTHDVRPMLTAAWEVLLH